ncbi:hypothetical protein [Xenorhabdus bovienii]|uniref:hypothetical protein n=1 Tax=Xenorhabdus bovienii TaxID=40576 RepID=UPI003DA666C3
MKNTESSMALFIDKSLLSYVCRAQSVSDLSVRLLESQFNYRYANNEFFHDDIKYVITILTTVSLSLAVTFSQHMQAVNILKSVSIESLKQTGLIASATTSVKGASLNSNVNLATDTTKLERECPIISYFSEATHIIFTGSIKNNNVIVFSDKQSLDIEIEREIKTFGMIDNHIQSIKFSVERDVCLIINDSKRILTDKILAFYAHLYWCIAWSAMFSRVVNFIKCSIGEYKFYHYEKMQQLLNIDLINNSLIKAIERNKDIQSSDNLAEDLVNHIQLNTVKIVISENVCNGMKLAMDILGFKKGYTVNDENSWLHKAYIDLLSSPLMFNNAELNKINIETLQILKQFKSNRHV